MERLCNAIDSLRRTYIEPKLLVMVTSMIMLTVLRFYSHTNMGCLMCRQGCRDVMVRKEPIVIMESGVASDQMLISDNLRSWVAGCRINDAPFLLEEDT